MLRSRGLLPQHAVEDRGLELRVSAAVLVDFRTQDRSFPRIEDERGNRGRIDVAPDRVGLLRVAQAVFDRRRPVL